jgi:YD repeat-containing protein
MKVFLFQMIFLLSCYSHIKAQTLQLGGVFDNRFENHTKGLKLLGHIKKLTEIDSVSKTKYVRYVPKVEYTLVWAFNPDGNYKETAQYRGDGTVAVRDVFKYNGKGQLLTRIHFDGLKEQSKCVCTVDVIHNKVQSDLFINGYLFSIVNTEKTYNKQGKVIERRLQYPSKPVEVVKFAYDKAGNLITTYDEGGKDVLKYDQNDFLIEISYFNKIGKLYLKTLYKNDQWGNHIEEQSSTDGGEFETDNTSYIYDDHHNWIQKTITGHSRTKIINRLIDYY